MKEVLAEMNNIKDKFESNKWKQVTEEKKPIDRGALHVNELLNKHEPAIDNTCEDHYGK